MERKGRMIFRAEANSIIGRGHLSRLSAIASMLENDFEIIFLISKANEAYCKSILSEKWKGHFFLNEDNLMGFFERTDVLWVDGYDFDDSWRLKFKPFVRKLYFVNDIPEKIEGADMVINHTPGINIDDYPKSKMDFLLGLDYAMLRSTFLIESKKKN